MVQRVVRPRRRKGRDGDRATVHAADPGNPATEVGPGAQPPGRGESLRVGLGTISSVVSRAHAAGLDWAQVQTLADEVLEGRLYGRPEVAGQRQRPAPDCAWIHAERRRPGVTLELLHLEYLERHPDGYRYTRFCDLYRRWLERRRLSMRQLHRAGDKCFVDYAGQKPRLIDPTTGEVLEVELFAAVLGASNYTYAEATRTQQVPDWIASHTRAFAFFGGVTAAIVCDQLKSGVVVPCRYEPGLQRTYEEFAAHYGTAILPARPAKPRDKAKIEAGVLVAERWILARLRHETFFSLAALNTRIAELLTDLNTRPMRLYRASRRELFERLDRPALRPLPAEPFVYGEWAVPASTSTTTSSSTATTTPSPTPLSTRSWTRGSAPRPSSSSIAASASPPIGAMTRRAGTPPPPPTCPRPTSTISSGRRRASSSGPRPSAPRPRRSSPPSSPTARIPSRATAPAWACSASAAATAPPASRPPVPGP